MILATIKFMLTEHTSKPGEYTFRTDMELHIGDILRDERYSNDPMKVIRIFEVPDNEYYHGYRLVVLTCLYTKIVKTSSLEHKNNMEKRNITVSLEEARNWYNGKDQTLRRLALQAYTEKELNEPKSFMEVLRALDSDGAIVELSILNKHLKDCKCSAADIGPELDLHMKLAIIARYFNGSWKPTAANYKYCLAKACTLYKTPNTSRLDNSYYIEVHKSSMYPGVVYFQSPEDVRKAYEMLKDELR